LFSYEIYVVAENVTMNKIHYFGFLNFYNVNGINTAGIDTYKNYLAYFINANIFVYRLNCQE
jgi:hypothetical protein